MCSRLSCHGNEFDREMSLVLSRSISRMPFWDKCDIHSILESNVYFPTAGFDDVVDAGLRVCYVATNGREGLQAAVPG